MGAFLIRKKSKIIIAVMFLLVLSTVMSVSAQDLYNGTQETQFVNETPAVEYKIEMSDDEVLSSTYNENLSSEGSVLTNPFIG